MAWLRCASSSCTRAVSPPLSSPCCREQHAALSLRRVARSRTRRPDRSVRILVFDIDNAHRFVRRIPLWPAGRGEDAETVRGTAVSARAGRLYISTTRRLAAIDLKTDKVVWEKSYEGHCCERVAVSPDGQTIYAPAFGSAKWYVVHAATGELRATIRVTGWPRDTTYSTRRHTRVPGGLGIADPVGQRHGQP